MRDTIHNTQATLLATDEEEDQGDDADESTIPEMELQPFEHHDYIMLLFHNEQDFQQACERMGVGRVKITYPGGRTKIGVGRCIDGAKAIRMLTEGT